MPLQKIRKHFVVKESDITIVSEKDIFIEIAMKTLYHVRQQLEDFVDHNPKFEASLIPTYYEEVPEIIERMQEATEIVDVGPMAAVAGAIADLMSERMIRNNAKIAVVENGGEVMVNSTEDIFIGLYSMTTSLKGKVGFLFRGDNPPVGLGTSSGTFGHAKSFGNADTVTVFSENAAIGDAAATRIANEVKGNDIEKSINNALEIADSLEKISGVFITRGKFVGKSGNIPQLVALDSDVEKKYIKSKIGDIIPDDIKFA